MHFRTQGYGETAVSDRFTAYLELLKEAGRTAGNRFFQQVKIPREFCFAPCQIDREREGKNFLPDVDSLPENRVGGRCKNGKITDRVWIS